jgi:hypothetical protein
LFFVPADQGELLHTFCLFLKPISHWVQVIRGRNEELRIQGLPETFSFKDSNCFKVMFSIHFLKLFNVNSQLNSYPRTKNFLNQFESFQTSPKFSTGIISSIRLQRDWQGLHQLLARKRSNKLARRNRHKPEVKQPTPEVMMSSQSNSSKIFKPREDSRSDSVALWWLWIPPLSSEHGEEAQLVNALVVQSDWCQPGVI